MSNVMRIFTLDYNSAEYMAKVKFNIFYYGKMGNNK